MLSAARDGGKNKPYGFQPLWHVDRQGYAHAVWSQPFATFTLDPLIENPITNAHVEGSAQFRVTTSVSALARDEPEGNGVTLRNAIQTSAAINPGNSGGALVDSGVA